MNDKKCKCCGIEKPLDCFSPQKEDNPYVLSSWCDSCRELYRTCTGCNENLPLEEFKYRKHRDYRESKCRKCMRNLPSAKKARIKYRKTQTKRLRSEKRRKSFEYLGGKCSNPDCLLPKYDWPLSIYEFHHRDPKSKEFGIASKFYYSWTKLKKELDKCELLCVLCHRLRHEEMRGRD